MTDEQWQRKLIKRWMEFGTIDHHSPNANDLLVLCNMVAKHEREACAKVAESTPRTWDTNAPDPQHRIASAIRERGTK